MADDERIKPTEKQLKARRNRSIGIALALVVFVIIVYLGTLLNLGPAVFDRAM